MVAAVNPQGGAQAPADSPGSLEPDGVDAVEDASLDDGIMQGKEASVLSQGAQILAEEAEGAFPANSFLARLLSRQR